MRKQHLTVWTTLAIMILGISGCHSAPSTQMVLENSRNFTAWRVLRDQRQTVIFSNLIKKSGLDQPLKVAGNYTIFAPENAAFEQLPKGTARYITWSRNSQALSNWLWYHIALVQITPSSAPEEVMGNSESIKISSNGRKLLKVNDAHIIGGPIYTRNATIYIIDKVLMPAGVNISPGTSNH